jgi:hypothetical protein
MFACLFESTVGVVDGGAAEVFLGSQAREHAARVAGLAILPADGGEVGVAVCFFTCLDREWIEMLEEKSA